MQEKYHLAKARKGRQWRIQRFWKGVPEKRGFRTIFCFFLKFGTAITKFSNKNEFRSQEHLDSNDLVFDFCYTEFLSKRKMKNN